jgi:hypothetical protein
MSITFAFILASKDKQTFFTLFWLEKCINSRVILQNSSSISSCVTRGFQYRGSERGLLTCFPDTDLTTAKNLMEARGIKQLPVVKCGVGHRPTGRRKPIALLHYDSIGCCLRLVLSLYPFSQSLHFLCFIELSLTY